ncbi:MAG: hypothetical protein JO267_14280 [Alphaproteobacteria bacterium]|nr:hypothetical protein [Alphaproteobacteria bacterium]
MSAAAFIAGAAIIGLAILGRADAPPGCLVLSLLIVAVVASCSVLGRP